MDLVFNEDVYRGSGNISLICLTNLGACEDVLVPVGSTTREAPDFDGGTTYVDNTLFRIQFTTPLVDASKFKVVVGEAAIQDARGNDFLMNVTCDPWLDEQWQAFLGPCTPTYFFMTPS